MNEVLEGMVILQYYGAKVVDAEHGEIYVATAKVDDPEAFNTLTDLGWFEDADDGVWIHYV